MSTTMPDRYQPDPWVDRTVGTTQRRGAVTCCIPSLVLQGWIGTPPGTRLSVAPRSNDAVTIGTTTPAILGTFHVTEHSRRSETPRAKVPVFALRYLDADGGETLRFHRVDDDRFRVEVVRE